MKLNLKLASLLFIVLGIDSSSAVADLNADLFCNSSGGGIAIKFPSGVEPAHIWQTDPHVPGGLELRLTQFSRNAHTQNLSFEGILVEAVKVKGKVQSGKLTYSEYDEENLHWIVVQANTPCGKADIRSGEL